ncbi:MAG: tetratricopeptide repeat protein [Verrucomicrobiota bacterium]
MKGLPWPHRFTVSAALGWVELGNLQEAAAELERLPADLLEEPTVLDIRWEIHALQKDWLAALRVARAMMIKCPDRVGSWLNQAYALRRVPGGGLTQAWNALLPAARQFPGSEMVSFNLACYAAQMDRLPEAWDFLQQAMRAGANGEQIRRMALADEDLQPLWERLRGK